MVSFKPPFPPSFQDEALNARLKRLRGGLQLELLVLLVTSITFATNVFLRSTSAGLVLENQIMNILAPAALAIVFVSDGIYSVLLIFVFVHPIWKTTTVADNARVRTPGVLAMKKTSRNALVGGAIAVLSSTCLYTNVFMAVVFFRERMFTESLVLNPQLVGINVDSVLNDLVRQLGIGFFFLGGGGVKYFLEG
jgi:hypothetical protein